MLEHCRCWLYLHNILIFTTNSVFITKLSDASLEAPTKVFDDIACVDFNDYLLALLEMLWQYVILKKTNTRWGLNIYKILEYFFGSDGLRDLVVACYLWLQSHRFNFWRAQIFFICYK